MINSNSFKSFILTLLLSGAFCTNSEVFGQRVSNPLNNTYWRSDAGEFTYIEQTVGNGSNFIKLEYGCPRSSWEATDFMNYEGGGDYLQIWRLDQMRSSRDWEALFGGQAINAGFSINDLKQVNISASTSSELITITIIYIADPLRYDPEAIELNSRTGEVISLPPSVLHVDRKTYIKSECTSGGTSSNRS